MEGRGWVVRDSGGCAFQDPISACIAVADVRNGFFKVAADANGLRNGSGGIGVRARAVHVRIEVGSGGVGEGKSSWRPRTGVVEGECAGAGLREWRTSRGAAIDEAHARDGGLGEVQGRRGRRWTNLHCSSLDAGRRAKLFAGVGMVDAGVGVVDAGMVERRKVEESFVGRPTPTQTLEEPGGGNCSDTTGNSLYC